MLEEMFPGMKFQANIVQPKRIIEPEVVLVIPEKTPDREIVPSRLPSTVRVLVFCYIMALFDVVNIY